MADLSLRGPMLLAVSAPAHAATLPVDPTDSTAYSTIQDAIDAALSGDSITVVAGTISECIDTSGKSLALSGAGASATTLDRGSACTSALNIEGGETVTLSDLSIDNASYRAIRVYGSTLIADSVKLSKLGANATVNGAGILADGATVSVSNATFSENEGGYGASEDGKASGCSVLGGGDAVGLALLGRLAAGRRRRET